MKSILSKKIILSIFVFLAAPFFTFAADIDIKTSPTYPEVGQNVSVHVSSLKIDINQAEISWYKDNKLEKKGIGMKNYSFAISENGNAIKAIVKTKTSTQELNIKINPSTLDVIWEATGGYQPPFYKGKISPIKGSIIKVVAIPQIKNESGFIPDASTFVYNWKQDGSNFAGKSGYGKNSFTYPSQILDRENKIEVSASGLTRSLAKNVTIVPSSSEIHFYEYSPAYGPLYNKALRNNQSYDTKKINVLAEPYFIFTDSLDNPSLITEWKINKDVAKTEQKNLLFLNIAEKVNKVDLTFKTDNKGQLLQETKRSLRLNILNNE